MSTCCTNIQLRNFPVLLQFHAVSWEVDTPAMKPHQYLRCKVLSLENLISSQFTHHHHNEIHISLRSSASWQQKLFISRLHTDWNAHLHTNKRTMNLNPQSADGVHLKRMSTFKPCFSSILVAVVQFGAP